MATHATKNLITEKETQTTRRLGGDKAAAMYTNSAFTIPDNEGLLNPDRQERKKAMNKSIGECILQCLRNYTGKADLTTEELLNEVFSCFRGSLQKTTSTNQPDRSESHPNFWAQSHQSFVSLFACFCRI